MPRRVAVATEGPASSAVIAVFLRRAGLVPHVLNSEGKDRLFATFHHLLAMLESRHDPDCFLVVPDLQPESNCKQDAAKWRRQIRRRFPKAILCMAIWETEAWLLADPAAIESLLRVRVTVTDPEQVGGLKPSARLEELYRQAKGYGRGPAFDKAVDGAAIAAQLDLRGARSRATSLDHLLRKAGAP